MTKTYNSESIKVLSDLEHIRLRKSMYIGSNGANALFNEIFDNATVRIDNIDVTVNPPSLVCTKE